MASAAPPAAQPPLPDEILEDIFLRLDAADDLARASASCASFRRIVSARGFLRRFRSLHPPPVLGFLDCSYGTGTEFHFHQAQPPRKWAPAARAFAQAADFTLSFLDDPNSWRVRDVRDGRVLLARFTASWVVFEDFVVYDPLHRRYVHIPSIPDDQTMFTRQPGSQLYETYFETFLAPAAWKEEESSLCVLCNVMSKTKVVAFVFSSVTGMWQVVASYRIGTNKWIRYPTLVKRHCAHGCFYWTYHSQRVMLVLDTLEMKFSMVDLPHESKGKGKVIVEAADGRLGLLILRHFEIHLYSKTNRHNDVGAGEWRRDNIIPLPDYCWSFARGGVAEGYVLLQGIPLDQCIYLDFPEKKPNVEYFTLQLKTLLFERLCVLKCETSDDYLYASFPPPLSPPSIEM